MNPFSGPHVFFRTPTENQKNTKPIDLDEKLPVRLRMNAKKHACKRIKHVYHKSQAPAKLNSQNVGIKAAILALKGFQNSSTENRF